MVYSTLDFAHAREISAQLLDELKLEAWLFEIEPRGEQWELRVECATDDGWETVTLGVPEHLLQTCCENNEAHQRLIEDWDGHLSACKRLVPSV